MGSYRGESFPEVLSVSNCYTKVRQPNTHLPIMGSYRGESFPEVLAVQERATLVDPLSDCVCLGCTVCRKLHIKDSLLLIVK